MSEKNIFGGGNSLSLYTPMSEDEQEVLHRLIEQDNLEIHIIGWGIVNKFERISFGDMRLQIVFRLILTAPAMHIPVPYFDLELRTRTGILLMKSQYPLTEGGEPRMLGAGSELKLAWEIAIRHMDPEFVKLMKPGAMGLTTREGNYKLPEQHMNTLRGLRKVEENFKQQDKQTIKKLDAQYDIQVPGDSND